MAARASGWGKRAALVVAALLGGCATPPPAARAPARSPAVVATTQPPAVITTAKPRLFVVAANPLATDAGMAVLRRGGSAVDAAIAVQAMLSLVEPQSSGVGGGAFMTYYDAASTQVTVYDGRETAPAGATPDMFLDDGGRPLPFATAVLSGRATGVPGAVKMLAEAHRRHGQLAWRELFGDAERTARGGFLVSPRLGRFLASGRFPESNAPDVLAYFARPGGGLLRPGDRLRNPAYAGFLQRLAAQGPDALYAGETARRIVARVHDGPLASSMTLADLAAYTPAVRQPLCAPYRVLLVCAPPPPASGVGLLELLGLLERTDVARYGADDPRGWYLFAEASRLMYADRDRYVGDPAFVDVPVAGLLAPAYLDRRARLIGERAGAAPAPGQPAGATPRGVDRTLEPTGTSHFVVGDAHGNVVSMTTTVESIFGSGRMVDGFFLNNQMTDFSFTPRDADGRAAANAPALVDDAADPARSPAPFRRRGGFRGGQCDPGLCRQGGGRRGRLGPDDATGAGAAQSDRARRFLPGRGGQVRARCARRARHARRDGAARAGRGFGTARHHRPRRPARRRL
jgi:gamma-glutamyltranspeptidase/glutathione hydrolase